VQVFGTSCEFVSNRVSEALVHSIFVVEETEVAGSSETLVPTELQGVASQKAFILILTTVRNSNHAHGKVLFISEKSV
jgi:hypothetical protein